MKLVLLLLCLCLCSCRRGMVDQAHTKPLTADPLNAAERSARPIPSHTVARGHLDEDESFFTGMTNGLLVTAIPVPINHDLLARGRERFDIYCAVCHGPTGDGNGMIVQRGAIIAYIRALQLSQHAPLAQLPPQEQAKLEVLKSR